MARSRDYRRHQAQRHMRRRLNEKRRMHANSYGLPTAWLDDPRLKGRMKEQPQLCSRHCCGNQRRHYGASIQERRAPGASETE